MAKRRSEKQLTQDNYDDDDETEESGTFLVADKADLANRIIKKAKRRNISDTPTSSPLANFSGFSTTPAGSPFSFFNKISQKADETPTKPADKPISNQLLAKDNEQKNVSDLKILNLSFLKWIQQHLDKNPYVVLVPVFRDYEKHLATLNLGASTQPFASNKTITSTATTTSIPATTTSKFSFKPSMADTSTTPASNFFSSSTISKSVTSTAPAVNFSMPSTSSLSSPVFKTSTIQDFKFGGSEASKTTAAVTSCDTSSLFKFGKVASSPLNNGTSGNPTSKDSPVFEVPRLPGSRGFSFGLPKPSTDVAPSATEGSGDAAAEEASDEPPQFDFVPVGEDDSVYDTRCKVFVKKEQKFDTIGVGTLYLKLVSGGKIQLIVRADTTQGSVLLNLILAPDLPLTSSGKNNILIVCIPTPEAKPPPVPVLIRVKTEEDRNKLLREMERLRAS